MNSFSSIVEKMKEQSKGLVSAVADTGAKTMLKVSRAGGRGQSVSQSASQERGRGASFSDFNDAYYSKMNVNFQKGKALCISLNYYFSTFLS